MRIMIGAVVLAFLGASSPLGEASAQPKKQIAITFDDAPRGDGIMWTGEERAPQLIKSLADAEVPGTVFFVTTRGLDKDEGRARIEAYAGAGHLIANHSDQHKWAMRTEIEAYLADIDEAERQLDRLEIADENRRSWFRFPFLDEGPELEKRDALREGLNERGLFNGYVTVDNYDWHIDSEARKAVRAGRPLNMDILREVYVDVLMGAVMFYDDLAVDHLGYSPPHVLLLHENDLAAMFIDDLVAALRDEGWEIISPDEAYAAPIADIVPQTLMTRQGHVAALAVEAGADKVTFRHLAISEEDITAYMEESGVFSAE